MKSFDKAGWIWCNDHAEADEYGEFYSSFTYAEGKTELFVSADSNYAVHINGELCASMQYADYPYDKVYDKIDITRHLKKGENHLAITVWYYGTPNTQVYYLGKAALIFEVKTNGETVAFSSESTPSRNSLAYTSHQCKSITSQLGFSFHYNASREDGWKSGILNGFEKSIRTDIDAPMRERPIKRLNTDSFRKAELIKKLHDGKLLFDLGINSVGLLELEIEAESEAHLTVAYGEHVEDGSVSRIIDNRDFSVEVTVPAGITKYTNPFRRLGAKYLEVEADAPVKIVKIGIRETLYPLAALPRPILNDKETSIYDICERTLRLCMHEHYEDCPWREQALYAMDSRNQMLCGYYAFGEFNFPKACIRLMAADNRPDGLLSICYPTSRDLVIPSFSLHFFTICAEYIEYSDDVELIREIYPKLISILKAFTDRINRNGLVPPFEGKSYWNFYEWNNGLSGYGASRGIVEPDIILNTLLSLALQKMAYISKKLGYEDSFTELSNDLNKTIRSTFFDKDQGVFRDRNEKVSYSVLGNSLAILAGVTDSAESAALAEKLRANTSLTPISLSMRCFLNDALLKVDKKKYAPAILEDIERIYTPMVEAGIGTVWETELGRRDFGNAGSLCHGWSALPIYYYHILSDM